MSAFTWGEESKALKAPKASSTGHEFEEQVQTSLEALGYTVQDQIQVGTRPNGGKHYIDLVATKDEQSFLISLKFQSTRGTAEQKIPYELICLSEALKQARGKHKAAYLVLGGDGWTLKKFYLSGGLDRHLKLNPLVKLLSPKDLLKLASEGKL